MKKIILFTLLVGASPIFAQCPSVTTDLTALVKRLMLEEPRPNYENMRVISDTYTDDQGQTWGFDKFSYEWITVRDFETGKIGLRKDFATLSVRFAQKINGACTYDIDIMGVFDLVQK